MKKTIIFLLLLLLGLGTSVQAQYSDYYYHRVGDTVEWRSEIGYYSWWEFEPFYEENLILEMGIGIDVLGGYLDSSLYMQYYYTPVPLKIIGIAGTGCWPEESLDDTAQCQDRYLIYEADSNGLHEVVNQVWSPSAPHRTLHLKTRDWNPGDSRWHPHPIDSCCTSSERERYIPFHEYYFDSAIYVTDSFYVGGTFYCNIGRDMPVVGFWSVEMYGQNVCNSEYQAQEYLQCTFPIPRGVYKYNPSPFSGGTFHNSPWVYYIRRPILIYPIIEVDTTVVPRNLCDSVANVQATVSGTSVVVTWDDFPNYTSVMLRYGHCNMPQEQWQEVDVTGSTLHTLTGLTPTTCYGVSIKALCDSCKKETPWSAPVYFYTGQDTTGGSDTTGIAPSSLLSVQTFLQPNPAHDEVTVSSSFGLQRIEITDAKGVMVYSEPATGHQATVPTGHLRAGTYIVTIRTHYGTTHKRLIVTR